MGILEQIFGMEGGPAPTPYRRNLSGMGPRGGGPDPAEVQRSKWVQNSAKAVHDALMMDAEKQAELEELGNRQRKLIAGGRIDQAISMGGQEQFDALFPELIGGGVIKKVGKLASELINLRNMPVEEAIALAKQEPHLIPSGSAAEGKYIGGPRSINSKRALTNVRRELDESIDAGAPGGDWYDRYRAGVDEVTGNPNEARWMANTEGQFSAGVDPGSELGYAIKETNGIVSGYPVKAARPAQHEALLQAVADNDPYGVQLGKKTGEYADKVYPHQGGLVTATGVNDFRHARNLRYTEPDGTPQRNAVGDAAHGFMDYETALAVGRARERGLAGRSDWTGEQIQATAWVKQKADDIYGRGKKNYDKKARLMMDAEKRNDVSDEAVEVLGRELAFADANRTIADFFPKHTAYGTYESMPGPNTGHLPGSVDATQAQRNAIGTDPAGSFATAPGNRDAIYAGLSSGDTGNAMRVRPTVPMQGIYDGGKGIELNPGEVARPLVGYTTHGAAPKTLAEGDKALLQAGEGLRAAISGQDAGAAHVVTNSGRVGDRNAVRGTLASKLSPEEAMQVRDAADRYGYGDIVDTGDGVTMTNFGGGDHTPSTKEMSGLAKELAGIRPDASDVQRMSVDDVYADLTSEWKAGEGSGAVSSKIINWIEDTPELAAAMDKNPHIAQVALNYIARDKKLSKSFGPGRKDLQTLREIIGAGPGWVGRVKEAIKAGIVPALGGMAILKASEESGPST